MSKKLLVGGHNDRVVRRVGRGRYQHIVLKRGMLFAHAAPPTGALALAPGRRRALVV